MEESKKMLEIYNNNYKIIVKEYFNICAKLIPYHFNSILDIGCANGSFLNYINNIFQNKKIVGIDKNIYSCNNNGWKFIHCDFLKDNSYNEKFDVVTCMGVLSIYENIDLFFEKLTSFANKNSTIILFDNVNIIDADFKIQYRKGGNFKMDFKSQYYSYWYSKNTFIKLGEKYDFNVEFIPFKMPFEIKRSKDYTRAYTKNVKGIHEQYVLNDFPINFYFIKFTKKNTIK